MAAVSMILIFCGSALGAEWNFYGSARMATFWTESDLSDTTSLNESLQSNARIGAKVRVSDELTGRFEYGAKDGDANIRYLYGEWDFGPGSLLVGQYETPLYMPVSNQVYNTDNGLEGWGEAAPGRRAQIRLKFGGFQIAAVEAKTQYYDVLQGDITDTNTELTLPRVEVSYTTAVNNLTLGVGAGYSTFEVNDSEDIDSYVGVACGKFHTGAFSFGVQAFAGQNVGNIITTDTTGDDLGKGHAKIAASGRVIDNDAIGFEVVAGYSFNEMFAVEAGYGYTQTEYDDTEDDEVAAYYVQAPITLAPGVLVVPEFGMIDYQESNQDEITYMGAKWQINF